MVCPGSHFCSVAELDKTKFSSLVQLVSLPLYLPSSKRFSALKERRNSKGRGRQETYTNKRRARTER